MSEQSLIMPQDFYEIVTVQDPQVSPDGDWIAFVRVSTERVENKYRRAIWLARTDGSSLKPFTTGLEQDYAPRWSPDGKYLAFVSTRNGEKPQIYLIPTDGGEARPLTDMPHGAENPAWSPDSHFIAFSSRVNAQEREKEDTPQDDEEQAPPEDAFEAQQRRKVEAHREAQRLDPRVIRRQPYRAGTQYLDDRYTHIYILPVDRLFDARRGDASTDPAQTAHSEAKKEQARRLTEGDLDFDPPIWSPDGAAILTAATREPGSVAAQLYQDVLRIPVPAADAAREAPVRLTAPGFCSFNPRPSHDGRFIAYLRQPQERITAQAKRLTVIPSEGGQPYDVTPDFDRGVNDFRWSSDGQSLLFTASDQGDTGIYKVPASGGVPTPIVTGRRETVSFDIAQNGQLGFIACTPERPPDLYTAAPDGSDERRLTDFNQKFLTEKQVLPVEEIWYQAPDGVEIQGWVIKPPNFDPHRTFPLAVEIHGGPHTMWGPSARTMWHEWQCLAAQGYVVFFCNPRGSTGYGYAFCDAIHGRWGEADMPDILSGVDDLISQGYVDPARLAITGGSYGGFMTGWVIGHDERFAAAVSQRGVYHLSSFFGTTDVPELVEIEFDTPPWENPEKLWQFSPLAYVSEIKTPLLILHSEQDFRVPIPDAEQLYLMLRWLGREVEFVRYPREGHELSRSGEPKHIIDRLERIIEWFDKYCQNADQD